MYHLLRRMDLEKNNTFWWAFRSCWHPDGTLVSTLGDIPNEVLVPTYLQWIDQWVNTALLNVGNFLPDVDHGIAESIQLCLIFRFGGLNHESPCHRPRHGRGMKSCKGDRFTNICISACLYEKILGNNLTASNRESIKQILLVTHTINMQSLKVCKLILS